MTFSDGAKIASIAKNISLGNGYGSSFSSFGADRDILNHLNLNTFPAWGRQPLMSYAVALSFGLFGISDNSLLSTSIFFYVLSIITIFLLAKNIFNEKVGFLSAVAFIFIPTFWEYALNGASESLFVLEIVLTFLLLTYKNKKLNIIGLFVAGLSYFTRPQGFILIIGALSYYIFTNSKNLKSAFVKLFIVLIIGVIVDLTILTGLTGKTFFYSILSKGADVSVLYTPSLPATTGLRTSTDFKGLLFKNSLEVGKKIFYNTYNLYKLMPDIMPYFIFVFFVLSIFIKEDERNNNYLKNTFLFMFVLSILSTSISIPFFRYLHPFVPLLLIYAINIIYKITKSKTAFVLIFVFLIGGSLGTLFLDSRFISNTKNLSKPPIYVLMANRLKENTPNSYTVVTNLDTWGSWYGERKTIWYPLEPSKIIPVEDKIDAIYLTSYLIDDENYYMGENWREILENPQNQTILKDYKYAGSYEFSAEDNYQRQDAKAILLIKK